MAKFDGGLNLIDLKDNGDGVIATSAQALDADDAIFDFGQLKLVEEPNSPKNSKALRQTLEDCVGFLRALPLKQPNANQKNPQTVVDMINILASPEAAPEFEKAMNLPATTTEIVKMNPKEYKRRQLDMYDPSQSEVWQTFRARSKKKTSHKRAPSALGQIVKPGCMSFYTKHGITYAAGEGKWTRCTSFSMSRVLSRIAKPPNRFLRNVLQVAGGSLLSMFWLPGTRGVGWIYHLTKT